MGWAGHKTTFVCLDHPKLTVRARRYRMLTPQSAPRCRTCGKPMLVTVEVCRVREFGRIRKRKYQFASSPSVGEGK